MGLARHIGLVSINQYRYSLFNVYSANISADYICILSEKRRFICTICKKVEMWPNYEFVWPASPDIQIHRCKCKIYWQCMYIVLNFTKSPFPKFTEEKKSTSFQLSSRLLYSCTFTFRKIATWTRYHDIRRYNVHLISGT